jgi:crotonobetainyl-CoA:carnitine CoA-transferase CaiB-like acyl-CoA transferase
MGIRAIARENVTLEKGRWKIIMAEETWKDYKKRKFAKPMPLKGIRALEVCTLLLGPFGTSLLGQLGAEVIKCEIPPMGDIARSFGPFGWLHKEQGTTFMDVNPNKHWIGIDLHRSEGQKVFQEFAVKSDIIEDNLRPGVMERWNVGYRQIG